MEQARIRAPKCLCLGPPAVPKGPKGRNGGDVHTAFLCLCLTDNVGQCGKDILRGGDSGLREAQTMGAVVDPLHNKNNIRPTAIVYIPPEPVPSGNSELIAAPREIRAQGMGLLNAVPGDAAVYHRGLSGEAGVQFRLKGIHKVGHMSYGVPKQGNQPGILFCQH